MIILLSLAISLEAKETLHSLTIVVTITVTPAEQEKWIIAPIYDQLSDAADDGAAEGSDNGTADGVIDGRADGAAD
jgi:hypothetical protein